MTLEINTIVRTFRRQAGDGVSPLDSLLALVPPGSFHAVDLSQTGQPKYPFKATDANNRRCSHRSP